MEKGEMGHKKFSRNRPRSDRMESDFYQTPYCLTDQFVKAHVLKNWPKESQIWDFCCGEGTISHVLTQYPYHIFERDITMQCNFFDVSVEPPRGDTAIDYGIMNPPFRLFNEWVKHCFDVFSVSFALLAPTTYLQGFGRYNKDGTGIFQNKEYPLAYIYTFNRYPMLTANLRPDGLIETGMQALSWFVWTRNEEALRKQLNTTETIHRWLDIDNFVLRKGRKR